MCDDSWLGVQPATLIRGRPSQVAGFQRVPGHALDFSTLGNTVGSCCESLSNSSSPAASDLSENPLACHALYIVSQKLAAPLFSVVQVLYLIMIVTLKHVMSTRQPIYLQPIVLTWNFGLSLFSMAGRAAANPIRSLSRLLRRSHRSVGMLYTVPQLLYGEDVGLITVSLTA